MNSENPRTWADYERERVALQRYSPKFSRAELCRRAGISDTTMLKGLRDASKAPRRGKRGAVAGVLSAEREKLTPDQRELLDLALAGERAAIKGALRADDVAEAAQS